jgi:hypothetical protein
MACEPRRRKQSPIESLHHHPVASSIFSCGQLQNKNKKTWQVFSSGHPSLHGLILDWKCSQRQLVSEPRLTIVPSSRRQSDSSPSRKIR